jgi:hypothetical protein
LTGRTRAPATRALDVALTWVIGATSGGLAGRAFMQLFLRHVDRQRRDRRSRTPSPSDSPTRNVTNPERTRQRRLLH